MDLISREAVDDMIYDYSRSCDVNYGQLSEQLYAIPSAFEGMTNGEVIQALFPNPHIDTKSHTVWVGYDEMSFTRKWWNTPYKAESEE